MADEKVSFLNQVLAEWDVDSVIGDVKLDYESLNTPKIHSKYLRHLASTREKLSKARYDSNEMRILKKRYYNGALTKEELQKHGWDQYQYSKPLKGEMEELLNGDRDLVKLKLKIEYLETIIVVIESILTQLKSRNYQIKDAITWRQFQSGA